MSKIGIVTFHNAHNFGAVLQCLALQESIKELNHDVEVINYSCDAVTNGYTDGSLQLRNCSLKEMARSIIVYAFKGRRKKERYNKFNNFINKNLNLSEQIDREKEWNANKYDSIVFGSDQIWNIFVTNKDTFYFGDFPFQGKKISYGASVGNADTQLNNYFNLLNDFEYLGVRENSIRTLLINNNFHNCFNNIDPTLLLPAEKWIKLLNLKKKSLKKEYVLVYPLRERTQTVKAATDFAKRLGLDIIEIGSKVLFNKKRNRVEKIGPLEFLDLIYNSKYVITNSFHGTVFSIIFNKDFNTVALNDGEDGRIINLLHRLQLDNRIVNIGERINEITDNYNNVNKIIENDRVDSINFLSNALQNE